MTQAPLPYLPVLPMPSQWEVDRGHLKILAICHYVAGGLEIAFSSIFIVHIVMGVVLLNNPSAFGPQPGMTARSGQPPPPDFVGWMFIGMGSCAVLFGWAAGVLTILSGRGIARRRGRTFSLVVAGVNCLWVPIGTVLGVFTFILLLRPSVAALYEQEKSARTAYGSQAAA